MNRIAAVLLVATLVLPACQDMGPKQGIGTLGGAAGGALLGSQFGHGTGKLVGVGIGTLVGAMVGSEIGRSMDATDRARAEQAEQRAYAAPINQPISWSNPQSGNSGTIIPTNEGRRADGAYCREFQQNIVVGGQTQRGYGTACREPDGSWRIVNNQ